MSRKFLNGIDLNKTQLINGVVHNAATAPSSPVAGQLWYDTTANALKTWNGTSWVSYTDQTVTLSGDVTGSGYPAITVTVTDDSHNHAIGTSVTGLGTGVATFLATPSTANLAAALTDETGTGAVVFSNAPDLTSPKVATSIVTAAGTTSLDVFNTVATTVNAFGAATTLNLGATTGVTNIKNTLDLATGTTGLAPMTITDGSLVSPIAAGNIEAANNLLYYTPNTTTSRGIIPIRWLNRRTANRASLASTTLTAIFDETGSAFDTLTLTNNVVYRFKCQLFFDVTYSANAINPQFGITFSQVPQQFDFQVSSSTLTAGTGATWGRTVFGGASATAYSVAAASSASQTVAVTINGMIETNATTGGTIVPQFACSTAASGNIVIRRNSYFEIEKLYAVGTNAHGAWA